MVGRGIELVTCAEPAVQESRQRKRRCIYVARLGRQYPAMYWRYGAAWPWKGRGQCSPTAASPIFRLSSERLGAVGQDAASCQRTRRTGSALPTRLRNGFGKDGYNNDLWQNEDLKHARLEGSKAQRARGSGNIADHSLFEPAGTFLPCSMRQGDIEAGRVVTEEILCNKRGPHPTATVARFVERSAPTGEDTDALGATMRNAKRCVGTTPLSKHATGKIRCTSSNLLQGQYEGTGCNGTLSLWGAEHHC